MLYIKKSNAKLVLSLAILSFLTIKVNSVNAQRFIPTNRVGGSNPPDIVNDPPDGNVGIGLFQHYPNPVDKLTVGGDISLFKDDPYSERSVMGRTRVGILNVFANTLVNDGGGLRLYGINTSDKQGAAELSSTLFSSRFSPSHLFTSYDGPKSLTRMMINNYGVTGIGLNVLPSFLNPNDQLTVENSICIKNNLDEQFRTLRARTYRGGVNLVAGENETDGPAIQMFGTAYQSNPQQGGIRFISKQTGDSRAFDFVHNYGNSNAMVSSLIIDRGGNARFGPNNPVSERLTVDGDIYLYNANDAFRDLRARSYSGGINVRSGSTNTDGSALTLYASNHASNPGQVLLTARGNSGKAFNFQSYNPNTSTVADRMTLDYDGSLHLSSNLQFNLVNAASGRFIQGKTTTSVLTMAANETSSNGSSIELFGSNSSSPGEIHFVTNGTLNPKGNGFEFANWDPTIKAWKSLMNIHKNGKVVIGDNPAITTPGSYRLYVDSGIITTRINVALKNTSAWADYVFEKDYKLMPLEAVAAFIDKYKHLPNVPSAEDVVRNGLELEKMDAVLLRKLEELTLYALEQQKLIKAQGEAIESLQRGIASKKKARTNQ